MEPEHAHNLHLKQLLMHSFCIFAEKFDEQIKELFDCQIWKKIMAQVLIHVFKCHCASYNMEDLKKFASIVIKYSGAETISYLLSKFQRQKLVGSKTNILILKDILAESDAKNDITFTNKLSEIFKSISIQN